MDALKIAFLIIVFFGILAVGYLLMRRIDKFLEERPDAIESESERRDPACIMLTDDMSDEEIVSEIRKFRDANERIRIVIRKRE